MNLTKDLAKKVNDLTTTSLSQSDNPSELIKSTNDFIGNLEQKEQKMITKKIKKSDITNQVSKKPMKLPIGKLFSTKKGETKEATGSGAAGGFVAPLQGEMKEKWSKKYKDSIDCNNPKGFSQRAHCSGKSKKVETKEATSSSSVGAYDAPGFEDVNMKGNHERGSGRSYKKTQIPGGKFVQVKEKCKKFPYCNQGDINALNIFENKTVRKVIKDISKKYNISEQVVKNIIEYEYNLIKDKL